MELRCPTTATNSTSTRSPDTPTSFETWSDILRCGFEHLVLRPQCDENTTFSNHALYLGLPCCKDDFNSCPNIPSSLVFQRSTKETFWISTQLSSTKLTQNGTNPEIGPPAERCRKNPWISFLQ